LCRKEASHARHRPRRDFRPRAAVDHQMIRRRRSWREPSLCKLSDEALRSAISIRLLRVEMESKRLPVKGRPWQANAVAGHSNLSTGSKTSRQDSHCASRNPAGRKAAKEAIMTDAERREKARLRSERWRRAHGIGPRRPAQQPWLAEGVSRSTWVQAQAAGAAGDVSGLCMCHPRTGGSLRGGFNTRPCPVCGA
jgi:hypothetical protein